MKQILWVLTVLISSVGISIADTPPETSTPHELAQRIITLLQSGQGAQIKSEIPDDISILEKGTKESPDDPLIYFALGGCYMAQENVEAAVSNMEKAYNLSQKNVAIGLMYALVLKIDKQPEQAYKVDKELSLLHPDVLQVQSALVSLDLTIQKYDEASTMLDALLQLPANQPAMNQGLLLFMKGTCYLYQGDRTKAIETLEKAHSLAPSLVVIYMPLSEAYLKNGDLTNAEVTLDKIMTANPTIPSVLYDKGIYYEKTGKADLAMKSFQDAYTNGKQRLQIGSDNGGDLYLMYLVCKKLSKPDEAASYKSEAEKLLYTYEAPWKQT